MKMAIPILFSRTKHDHIIFWKKCKITWHLTVSVKKIDESWMQVPICYFGILQGALRTFLCHIKLIANQYITIRTDFTFFFLYIYNWWNALNLFMGAKHRNKSIQILRASILKFPEFRNFCKELKYWLPLSFVLYPIESMIDCTNTT